MKQSCTFPSRRGVALGAAVAVVAASSAFGLGATAASATTPTTATATATAVTTHTTEGTDAAGTAGTTGTVDTRPGGTGHDRGSAAPDGAVTTDATGAAAGTGPAADTGDGSGTGSDRPAGDAGAALTFADDTTTDAPLVLTATAGDRVERAFTASGGTDPITYTLRGEHGEPVVAGGAFDLDFALDETTGQLSGTARAAAVYTFQVVATSGTETAVEHVALSVSPGAPVGVTFAVTPSDGSGSWQVDADGTVHEQAAGQGQLREVDDVRVTTGTTLSLAGLAVDAHGNRTTGSDADEEYPRSTVTSTVAGDRADWDPTGSNRVSFAGAGSRTLTVSEGGVSTAFDVVVSDVPFAFTDRSSSDAPLTVAATAGETFRHAFAVVGAPDPDDVRYELRDVQGGPFDGDALERSGLRVTIDSRSGVLSGTATAAIPFRFRVVASSGGEQVVGHVEVDVAPGALARIALSVSPDTRDPDTDGTDPDGPGTTWWQADGGAVTERSASGATRRIDAVPAHRGDRFLVSAFPVDAHGNPVADTAALEVRSDVPGDRLVLDADRSGTVLTLDGTTTHVVTASYGGRSETVRFTVPSSATTTPVAATATGHAATSTGHGTLAWTGADTSGPLAWALGLLAAGGGVLLLRLRRRRS